ncbi:glycosyltransferase family 2 protein [Polynucleobacter sp. Ross1-W9]|uniref:glycosyltransferase family 2 protein n=1 Tax=Polynucleobacter parvulilacunae TaxID=1855631 RepID=UPI001C0B7C58|nr:glycosyltransferase family 2 protein [Polynucleobacter parvulilacunae]MBU3557628.1 glycosyltransferase family 2 protein [Polynucleobacter parvulilacunae]
MSKPIPVVIPYFRAPDAIKLTLKHLESQRGIKTVPYIRDNSEDNVLFTKAINEGIQQFSKSEEYDYILVLNQDALLHEECLEQLVLAMDHYPHAGICAPIALSRNKSVNWAGSAAAFPWGSHISYDLTRLPKAPFETYWINGACMLIRVSMIQQIGLFDENMKFICSDADYSFTARSRGWTCLVVPSAFVEHEPSGSGKDSNLFITKIKLEDQLYFSRKWVSSDLYKFLSLEGPQLSPEFIKAQMEKTQLELAVCNRLITEQGGEQ